MLLVLVTLGLSVAVVATLGLAGFADVAFHSPEYSAVGTSDLASSPPHRQSTYDWFSTMAECMTLGLIATRRDTAKVRCVAAVGSCEKNSNCGECHREPIPSGFCSMRTGMTPPEALEIAEFLRQTQPEERVEAIRSNAAVNTLLRLRPDRASTKARCPLACDDGTCVAMPVRPIQCRVQCALFGLAVVDESQAAVDGKEEGLRKAMKAAALDEDLYELNSALATALSGPDIAARWRGGDNPFAQCDHYFLS